MSDDLKTTDQILEDLTRQVALLRRDLAGLRQAVRPAEDRLLTVKEVAGILNLGPESVRRKIRRRTLPSVDLSVGQGSRPRLRVSSLALAEFQAAAASKKPPVMEIMEVVGS